MEHKAPDLIGYDEEQRGCFVKKQPTTAEETYRMLQAMSVNEVEGLRYSGTDPELSRRIAEAGMASCCERPCGRATARVARTRAWVECDEPTSETLSNIVHALYASVLHTNVPGGDQDRVARLASVVAALDKPCLDPPIPSLGRIDEGFRFDLRPFPAASTTSVSVRIGSGTRAGIDVSIGATGFYEQLRTSVLIDDFLRVHPAVRSIRWFTELEWNSDLRGGQAFPF